ncbi:glycosyltransferase [Mastigocoleus sp. MO_188.B34]|uniref:glycosyltransferase family protein n=1 Tax=Mastigocoleus sp. MO_188.B34 TaxID=3036635 RepID=UPI002612822D|nr:glycosyltransferase [Mastigocoleus sp. MO_188.B34]MDJ0693529.1 glycosyltransferase [Mastigocoleus sp. MO_188.B34]
MKKIMFYCQNLLGMGHLVRTTEIIRNLVKDFEVCLIDGGQIVEGFQMPDGVEVVHLPAIKAEGKQIKVVNSSQTLEEVQEIRKRKLMRVFDDFQPDCLVTEGYPFSKKKSLAFELVPLLQRIKASGRDTKIVCSLRDIIMVKQYGDRAKAEKERCELMNQYYDMLLIHSDPKLHRLEENFSLTGELECQINYTGYVAQSSPKNIEFTLEDIVNLNRQEPTILVSVGGGRLGHDLLECVIDSASIIDSHLPHHIQIFAGPFMPEEKFVYFQKLAADKSNVTFQRYTPNLLSYMERARLSISLGGYNTTMNVLRTGVNSMIYPSNKDSEQRIRAEKLEQLGILSVVRPEDLQADIFASKVIDRLQTLPTTSAFGQLELQGAQKTAQILKDVVQSKVAIAA